ncbi:hypothetical protein DF3PA_70140 [Candidatus Defluviicoccus seviourii]|uniref:Uncharacterized protein n=1 Tax=Candidatus Defluviicoccus seviourii TaxID=2565273 RepID=A0A564WIA8_9PROT|nr:hypothetical protein DF3PA_70140 [Candidatus Defluviicoccus seviourii]
MVSFTTLPKAPGTDLRAVRRKIIENLEDQLLSAQAMIEGKPYTEVKRKWLDRRGKKLYLIIRISNRPLTDQDGEILAIEIGDDTRAPEVITEVIEAIKAGELDQQIDAHIAATPPRKRRK